MVVSLRGEKKKTCVHVSGSSYNAAQRLLFKSHALICEGRLLWTVQFGLRMTRIKPKVVVFPVPRDSYCESVRSLSLSLSS